MHTFWVPDKQSKMVSLKNSFSQRYSRKTWVRVVIDYTDTWFSIIVIEYLGKNDRVRETVLACSCGAQVESVEKIKRGRKSRDTVPFNSWSLDWLVCAEASPRYLEAGTCCSLPGPPSPLSSASPCPSNQPRVPVNTPLLEKSTEKWQFPWLLLQSFKWIFSYLFYWKHPTYFINQWNFVTVLF